MKFTARTLVALSLALGGLAVAQESNRLKVATVDMQTLFQEFHKTKETQATIEDEQKGVGKQLEERKAQLDGAKQELATLEKQLGDPSIADAKKQELFTQRQVKQQEAEALQREAVEFQNRKVRALQEQAKLRMKAILDELHGKVQKHAEAEAYDYVLDKSGASTSQVPILLYTKDATDITEALLKTINNDAPAKEEKKAGQ